MIINLTSQQAEAATLARMMTLKNEIEQLQAEETSFAKRQRRMKQVCGFALLVAGVMLAGLPVVMCVLNTLR